MVYPEVVIGLPTLYQSVTDKDIAYASAFIIYLGYFNRATSSLDQYTLNNLSEKEKLLICSVMFDISAYIGGALSIKELRLNFMPGSNSNIKEIVDQFTYEPQPSRDIKNSLGFKLNEIEKTMGKFWEKNENTPSIILLKYLVECENDIYPSQTYKFSNMNYNNNLTIPSMPFESQFQHNGKNRCYESGNNFDVYHDKQTDFDKFKDMDEEYKERMELRTKLDFARKELFLLEASYQKQIKYIFKMIEHDKEGCLNLKEKLEKDINEVIKKYPTYENIQKTDNSAIESLKFYLSDRLLELENNLQAVIKFLKILKKKKAVKLSYFN
ncbi:hypothetical protein HZS_6456 [Henneguya salminicola]|nr:hypothetical protein HZS_6456 [Henneguya salminicola]